MDRLHQVAANPEEIIDRAVNREKTLDVAGRFEAAHLTLSLTGGLMGDFGSVIGVLIGTVVDGREGSSQGGPIAAQLIRNESVGNIL